MNIISNEIKKIFNIKSVVLLILINIIMYSLFINFHIETFPNGRPNTDDYKIFVEMKNDYGELMDEEEFKDFKRKYEEVKIEADEYIESREDLKELGITNYDEFSEFDEFNDNMSDNDKKIYELRNNIIFTNQVDVFWELTSRETVISSYENRIEYMTNRAHSEKQEIRIKDILEKNIETSVFPQLIFSNYNSLIESVAITILLSVMFIITPIYLKDNKGKVNYLQYTSKTGRGIFKKKIIAGVLSTFILVTIQLICFFIIYSTNNTSMFFNSNINSIYNIIISWHDLTFIQYIIVTVIGVYILGLVFSFIAMFASSISQNYIAVIGIQLPIALFTFSVLLKYIINFMTSVRYPKYSLGMFYITLMVISTVFIIVREKKEKRADILY